MWGKMLKKYIDLTHKKCAQFPSFGVEMERQNFLDMDWAELKNDALQIIPYRENRKKYNQIKEYEIILEDPKVKI